MSEVWELIPVLTPEYFLPSHLAPTTYNTLHQSLVCAPRPPSPPPPTDDLRLLYKDGYTKSAVSFDVHIMSLPSQEPSSYSLHF